MYPTRRSPTRMPTGLVALLMLPFLMCITAGTISAQDCIIDFWQDSILDMVPLDTNPVEPGGRVEITLDICNVEMDPLGPICQFPIITMLDELSRYFMESPNLITWNSNHWFLGPTPPGCREDPAGDIMCNTMMVGVFDPGGPNGGCSRVVAQAYVEQTISDTQVCNQAHVSATGTILDICDPRGGVWGCNIS